VIPPWLPLLTSLALALPAQQQPSPPRATAVVTDEAKRLAAGWTALAAGNAAEAAAIAAKVLGETPNSAAALVLLVDADIARAGAQAGLGAYESWLGGRRLDDAYVLRRIAQAMLRDAAVGDDAAARLRALGALAGDRDAGAVRQLNEGAGQGRLADTIELARLGQERAIAELIKQLESPLVNRKAIIDALGSSRNRLALAPLVALLADADMDIRALSAEALGRLGAQEATASLRPLVADERAPFPVRYTAAGALHRLGDATGTVYLRNLLETSPYPLVRVQVAEKLASVPGDTSYLPVVRRLAGDPDPVVRITAARVLAPYDHALAQNVLEAAGADSNPAVREMAARTLATQVAGDFATLRRLLRSNDPVSRVAAAARILELTR
jgi:HEAT repeat protein